MKQLDRAAIFKWLLSFFQFLIIGETTYLLLKTGIPLATLFEVFLVVILLFIICLKIFFSKIKNSITSNSAILTSPVVFLLNILVLSTGGIASQFLILTHFFSIALGFLISPATSLAFIAATIASILFSIMIDQSSRTFIMHAPVVSLIYFVGYLTIVPFSYLLAKEYKSKEEWARLLASQIVTSKLEEEELLKNIEDAIILVNKNFELVYLNKAATKLTGFGSEVLRRTVSQIFSFKDADQKYLVPHTFLLEQTIISKEPTFIKDIQISKKDGTYLRTDLKILPLISSQGKVGLILIFKEASDNNQLIKSKNAINETMERFSQILSLQKAEITQINNFLTDKNGTKMLLNEQKALENLSKDLAYMLKLESGEMGITWSIVDIFSVLSDVIREMEKKLLKTNMLLHTNGQFETVAPDPNQPRIPLTVSNQYFVYGDYSWVREAFERLMIISQSYVDHGAEIKIILEKKGELVNIRIAFPSTTFPKEAASKIFEKFYNKVAIENFDTNSGLDGYIAKSLINRMRGNLGCTSYVGSSETTLTVTFIAKNVG